MDHTKEPWHTGGDGTIIYDSEGWGIANATVFHGRHNGPEEAKQNARRIVACVNSCAGIPTAALETVRLSVEAIEALTKQRDRLLSALRLVAAEVTDGVRPTSADSHLPTDVVREVQEAIASVEGGEK